MKEEIASVDIDVGKGWMDMAVRKDKRVRDGTTYSSIKMA